LWRALRSIRPDAVHLGDPNSTPLLTQLTRAKRVVTCHDAIPLRFPDRYFTAHDGGKLIGPLIERRRYRSADLVVAISDATANDAVTLLGVDRAKLVRVYNGVDVERWAREPSSAFESVLERHHLADRPFVLYVGGADWHKNVEGMMGGLAHARRAGLPVVLAWAAKLPQTKLDSIMEMARAAGVADAVCMLGWIPDEELAVLYRSAIAHLLVSRCEGFGLTIIEAMASGCPVITTDGGSLAEVAGDAALKVAPEDHGAIGDAIVRLSKDAALRGDLSERGRAHAPKFARVNQAREMIAAYERVIG
jgi:glycosyltransferase involved in cell wall biosynthesis